MAYRTSYSFKPGFFWRKRIGGSSSGTSVASMTSMNSALMETSANGIKEWDSARSQLGKVAPGEKSLHHEVEAKLGPDQIKKAIAEENESSKPTVTWAEEGAAEKKRSNAAMTVPAMTIHSRDGEAADPKRSLEWKPTKDDREPHPKKGRKDWSEGKETKDDWDDRSDWSKWYREHEEKARAKHEEKKKNDPWSSWWGGEKTKKVFLVGRRDCGASGDGAPSGGDGASASGAAGDAAAAPAAAAAPPQLDFPPIDARLQMHFSASIRGGTANPSYYDERNTRELRFQIADNDYPANPQGEPFWNCVDDATQEVLMNAYNQGQHEVECARHPGKSDRITDEHKYDLREGVQSNKKQGTKRRLRLVQQEPLTPQTFQMHIGEVENDRNYFEDHYWGIVWQFQDDKGWENYTPRQCHLLSEAYINDLKQSVVGAATQPPTCLDLTHYYYDPKAKKNRTSTYAIDLGKFEQTTKRKEGKVETTRKIRVILERVIWQLRGLHAYDGCPYWVWQKHGIHLDADGLPE